MQNFSQKRGVALGAVIALVTSFFAGVAPANAAPAVEGEKIALTAFAGTYNNYNGLIVDDFALGVYMLPGVATASGQTNFVFEVTRLTGDVDIFVGTTSGAVTAIAAGTAPASQSGAALAAGGGYQTASISSVVRSTQTTASTYVISEPKNTGVFPIVIRAYTGSETVRDASSLSGLTSTVKIKVWVENSATANLLHDPLEWYTEETVTLHAVTAVPVTGSLGTINVGDTVITGSATVGALNFGNLDATYKLRVVSNDNTVLTATQVSAVTETASPDVSAAAAVSRSGVVSFSFPVSASAGVPVAASLSGRVMATVDSVDYALGSSFSALAVSTGITQLFANVVTSANSTESAGTATVRTNTTNTFRIGAATNSTSVSRTVSVKFTSVDAGLSATKMISINGGAMTSSWPSATSPVSLTTGADGFATFTLGTSGFVGDETVTLTAYVGNVSKSITVEVDAATWTLTPAYTQYASGPGATSAITYTVTDQWLAKSTRTDQRIKVTRSGTGFNYAQTVSYHTVVAGEATVDFVPQAATATGSAKVDAALQTLNGNSGAYVDDSVNAAQVIVNVSNAVDAFGTGLAASRSVSVSYFPSTTSFATVTGKVVNTGSSVVISGTGLVFKASAGGSTFSNTLTVRADGNLGYSFMVAGEKAGTFTMTLTNGAASTTSLLIVDPASHSAGASMTFDTSAITPGRTAIVTGTLVDANGNPVDTTQGDGTASIVVTYAGTAGIPVGTMPTETDADGKFRISILTSAADSGDFTLTATYLKNGASTATVDKVTKVHTITVGAAAATSDQKVNAGSFKGYVAIYAKGYEGQRLSAKVGNDWVVVASLASNFERVVEFTGAGYTIAVRIYIDRVLVDTITVTTK